MFTSSKGRKRVWLLVGVILVFLGGIGIASFSQGTQEQTAYSLQQTLIRVSEEGAQAVVNIRTVQVTQDVFFNVVPQEGMGSGIIFDKEGYILTNEHVIHEAKEIIVVLTDGREFEGELIGSDPSVDIAVVKIEAPNLPVARLGDSDRLKPGEFCIAIGYPFGLQNTITFGVISALGRDVQESPEKILENLIQTDAAINPGNSGGPLINIEGEVIGINSAIIPYAQGIGFAIPINTATEIIDELIQHGRVIRPWLGVYFLWVTPQVKERFSLSVDSGHYITQVAPDSPAERAGIKEGDVIVKVDGQDMETSGDLGQIIKTKKIGEEVTLVIIREGKQERLNVTLAERPRE